MSYLLRTKSIITRKPHRCFGCDRIFPKGSKMRFEVIVDSNKAHNAYICTTCQDVEANHDYSFEYCHGDLYDEAIELENELCKKEK